MEGHRGQHHPLGRAWTREPVWFEFESCVNHLLWIALACGVTSPDLSLFAGKGESYLQGRGPMRIGLEGMGRALTL